VFKKVKGNMAGAIKVGMVSLSLKGKEPYAHTGTAMGEKRVIDSHVS